MAELLFSNEHLECLFDDRGGDLLLITFNELFTEADGRGYWAERVGAALGLSCLGIVSRRRNWFPAAGLQPHLAQLAPILARYRRRVSYGFSQGGYGAIRYSALLQTTEALAFSPQWSIAPASVAAFDRRYLTYFNAAWHAGMAIAAGHVGGRVFLFCDPHEPADGRHAALIAAASDRVRVVALNYLNHATVQAVASTAMLSALLAATGRPDLGAAELFQLLRGAKRNTTSYYIVLARTCLRQGHPLLADRVCAIAERMAPGHPFAARLRADIGAALPSAADAMLPPS